MKRMMLTIGLILNLAACTTIEGKASVGDLALAKQVCQTFSTITYDGKLDTPLTKEQVKQYNAKRKAFCAGTN